MLADRKEQNRLSAARWNALRRTKLEKLKEDLDEAKETEKELREKSENLMA